MKLLRNLWEGWKRVGRFMGDFIGRLVLTLFYFTLFLPFGLGMRLWGDRLDIKRRAGPGWLARSTRDPNLEEARRLS
ncbi:MAG: hypothetical protein ACE5E7_13060 [Anaerolineae bacterium]